VLVAVPALVLALGAGHARTLAQRRARTASQQRDLSRPASAGGVQPS
jgi:hypothetical protein